MGKAFLLSDLRSSCPPDPAMVKRLRSESGTAFLCGSVTMHHGCCDPQLSHSCSADFSITLHLQLGALQKPM